MVIKVSDSFIDALSKCTEDFKIKFRKAYQQLKVVDKPLEVKGVASVIGHRKMYKLFIDRSRIAMEWDGNVLWISCFLYNQFLDSRTD